MKIAIVNSLYKPYRGGGAEIVLQIVVAGLQRMGHEVFLITSVPWSGFRSLLPMEEIVDNSRVIRFFPLNFFWFGNIGKKPWWLRFLWHIVDTLNLHSFFLTRWILQREKPDLVLSHNLKGLGYTVPRAVMASHRGTYIHTVHDVQLYTPSGLIIKGKENSIEHHNVFTRFYRVINRFLFAVCPNVIFPSQFLKEFYEREGFWKRSKRLMIPNPVDKIMNLPSRHLLKGAREVLHFLYIGQIEEYKGVFLLINVLKALAYHNSYRGRFELHIVGAGSVLEQVKQLTGEDSHFRVYGYVLNENLGEIFSKMDLTIVPSLCYENFPTAILDSLRFGVPVLASDIGGARELIKVGYNGWLFPAGDSKSLQNHLREFFEIGATTHLRENCFSSIVPLKLDTYLSTVLTIIGLTRLAKI